jgi:hypothetical protein
MKKKSISLLTLRMWNFKFRMRLEVRNPYNDPGFLRGILRSRAQEHENSLGLWRIHPDMRPCEISTDMSSLYFGLDVFCQFECRVPEYHAVISALYTVQSTTVRGRGCMSNSRTLDFNRQTTTSPKYNDDISLLI